MFSFFRSAADMIAAQRLGCRVLLHIHGARFDEFYDRAGRVQRRMIEWSLTRADRVIALSKAWYEKLQAMAGGARLAVVENAVPLPPDISEGRHNGTCRFLLLARMDEWKGIDDLLDACAALHQDGTGLELVLAGPPGTAGNAVVLDQKIHTRNLESVVRYVGPVQGEGKFRLLRRADVYVQPSHHEGMPIAMLEAMSFGLPVIGTCVGSVSEVITDGRHGLLIPAHRPDKLASAMGELASSARRRRAMGHASRELVAARFSLTRFRDDVMSLYDEVVANPRAGLRERELRGLPSCWPCCCVRRAWPPSDNPGIA